ncbi:MAG: PEP-CTERM sorting domain-containing protein [Planctomycetota bacterium]
MSWVRIPSPAFFVSSLFLQQSISADGFTIVCNGINPDGYYEGWIATVSEPSTLLLLGLGGLLLRRICLKH